MSHNRRDMLGLTAAATRASAQLAQSRHGLIGSIIAGFGQRFGTVADVGI